MGRGQKSCTKCGATTGPRAKNCPSCGIAFTFKPFIYISPGKDVQWKELRRGDYIKSVQGHGPFFIGPDSEEVIFTGHYGIFRVHFVGIDGIGAYEIHKGYKDGGFCYLYMGGQKLGKTGSVMRAHKIKRVQPKVRK